MTSVLSNRINMESNTTSYKLNSSISTSTSTTTVSTTSGGNVNGGQSSPTLDSLPAPVSKENNVKEKKHSDAETESKTVVPTYQVKLERVLGITVPSNAALDSDPNTGIIAYPAGCTVVLLNPRRNVQSFVQNPSRKTVTCVAFSSCGRYLATGECGHTPLVRVWDLSSVIAASDNDTSDSTPTQVAEFAGHKFGIFCVAFSPAQKYVVSVGSQHDMIVNVWDWRAGVKVASNKFSSKVKSVSFAENGSYFVTVGNRHVKFWYLDPPRGPKFKEPVPLTGRSAILGEQRNNYFCDVATGRGAMADSTFAITKSGLLCEFNNRRLLDKWVELRTPCANCLVAGEEFLFVGCADGIIRCFSPFNLQFITTLPRTHYLGVDVAKGVNIKHMCSAPPSGCAKFPDTVALSLDLKRRRVTAVYDDHSLYLWDISDVKRVGKSHSYLYHSACIWGVEMYPNRLELPPGVRNGNRNTPLLPEGSFITCSSDDTIRIWNVDADMPTDILPRNIYSQDLLKILYVDSDLTYLKDLDVSPSAQNQNTNGNQGEKGENASYDSRNGVRCLKVSPDGQHLASGDRAGNIRIHDFNSWRETCKIEAHDGEVLALEYSKGDTETNLLASASRDRLIHVFDVAQEYGFVQTLDDHSSAITSVRFLRSPQGGAHMVSCGADRSIIFRTATLNPQNELFFTRGQNIAGKTTLYDMEVDHGQRHILTACQDRNIRVYNVSTGKHSKTFKGAAADDGTLIKISMDSSGLYVASSCTDKSLSIWDVYSGDCVAAMFGHSEIVTGIRFACDGSKLISVSGDGCIFVWSMPHDMVQIMRARLTQQAERAERASAKESRRNSGRQEVTSPNISHGEIVEDTTVTSGHIEDDEPDYRFSVGHLPLWAKKQITDRKKPSPGNADTSGGTSLDMPKGRWAQRLPNNPITFKSHYDTDSMVPYPAVDKRLESESSKESSLEDHLQKSPPPQPPPRRSNIKGYQHSLSSGVGSISSDSRKRNADGAYGSSHLVAMPTTDDSDVSSLRVDDVTTDHDGDIEDEGEGGYRSRSPRSPAGGGVYYPPSMATNQETPGDFTVRACDTNELRRGSDRFGGKQARGHTSTSQGPSRPTDLPLLGQQVTSGSQDSDEEEEASTPNADASSTTLGLHSVSCESVDRLGRREKFLRNNYESLEANGGVALVQASQISQAASDRNNKNSISYRFNCRHRSLSGGSGGSDGGGGAESAKRQELLRRIEQTRRKLQSIGYKSTLRSSKSISDLCNIPERDPQSPHRTPHLQDGGSGDSGFCSGRGDTGASGMRRACSLSDLSNPTPPKRILPNPIPQVGGKKSSRPSKSSARNQTNLSRSSSIGVLNQGLEESSGRTLRPTISSMNKLTPRAIKRKSSLSQAASTGDIRHLREDSSSEDTSPTEHLSNPRCRALQQDRRLAPGRAISERDLSRERMRNNVQHYKGFISPQDARRKMSQHSHISHMSSDVSRPSSVASTGDYFSPDEAAAAIAGMGDLTDSDIDVGPLSVALVESVCEWAVAGCERMSLLWRRCEQPTASAEEGCHRKAAARALLIGAATRSLQILDPIAGGNANIAALAAANTDSKDPRVVAMMQQYTDMLVTMVQRKMEDPQNASKGPD